MAAGNIDIVVEILFVSALENQITLYSMELFVIFGLRVGFPAAILEKRAKIFLNFLQHFRPNIAYLGKVTKAFLTIPSGFRP